MTANLDDPRITKFAILIEEAARSTEDGVRFFVEPAEGVLERAKSRRHHFIFGRRGSGKSSLIAKVQQEFTLSRVPNARVDLEPFKGHSYPDLLISVLIETFTSFRTWLDLFATARSSSNSIFSRLFKRHSQTQPFNKKAVDKLIASIDKELQDLKAQLYLADNADIEQEEQVSQAKRRSTSHKLGLASGGITPKIGQSKSTDSSSLDRSREQFRRSKVEFLRRRVLEYQRLFDELKIVSGSDAFLLLDDLYHIRRPEQASVVDYLHSVGKGHGLWLKVGTIRHRTTWYLHGNPPLVSVCAQTVPVIGASNGTS